MDVGRSYGLSIEVLNNSNYKVWKTCMESYLLGEDLWDIVGGDESVVPEDVGD